MLIIKGHKVFEYLHAADTDYQPGSWTNLKGSHHVPLSYIQ